MMLSTKPDQYCGMGEENFNALSYEEKREVRMAKNDAYMVRDRVPDLFWRITANRGLTRLFLSPRVRVQRSIAQEVQKKQGDTSAPKTTRARAFVGWTMRLPHTKTAPASVGRGHRAHALAQNASARPMQET